MEENFDNIDDFEQENSNLIEQTTEEVEFKPIGYKIMSGNEYMIFRNEYGGNVFYKIQISKKNYDGTKATAYKTVKFKKDVDIPDRTIIKILGGFEDFYFKDTDKFNPVFTLFITDFIITKNSIDVTKEAIKEYNSYDDSFDLPF